LSDNELTEINEETFRDTCNSSELELDKNEFKFLTNGKK
jgi:hypothetical protein